MRYLRFFIELIRENPVKSIMLGIIMLLIIPITKLEKLTSTKTFEVELSVDGKYCYIVHDSENNLEFLSFTDKPVIKDKRIIYQETHPLVIVSWIILSVLALLVIVASTIDDRATGWEFKDVWAQACVREVTCEFEDSCYYYQFEGRLIYKDKYQLDMYNSKEKIRDYYRNGKNLYPEFLTKNQRRDSKLKDLLG